MRRYRAFGMAILAGVLCSVLILTYASLHSGAGASSVELPTACDNFVAAAQDLATHGSSGGLRKEQVIFAANAADQPADMLKSLLSACDKQLIARAP